MQPTTRLRILEYLHKNQAASAHEISRGLGMTGANIRHHLAILEANDLVVVIDQRNDGRGRPANVYRVSNQILGSGLNELAEAIIDVWLGDLREEMREAALRSVAEKLAEKDKAVLKTAIPLRLALTVDRLNQLHYQARWEAGATGARVILGHCPYAEIVFRHPELCRMDAHLLGLRLALPVMQVAKLERGIAGLPQCIFTAG